MLFSALFHAGVDGNPVLEERGAEITKQIFEEMQKVHPVVLRYCGPEEKKEDWKQSVAAQQITLRQHPYLSYAYLIEGGESVQSIPGYEEGLFTVQDVSSMLVTEAAGLLGDELLLDVCAAPGGKSLHAAGLLKEGNVISRDLTDSKTALIEENSRRCNCSNIRIETFDALEPDENMIRKGRCSLCGSSLLRTWHSWKKAGHPLPDESGADGGACGASTEDSVRYMAVCEAGRNADVQYLYDSQGRE